MDSPICADDKTLIVKLSCLQFHKSVEIGRFIGFREVRTITGSISSGSVTVSYRQATLPLRSIRNFVKFHFIHSPA